MDDAFEYALSIYQLCRTIPVELMEQFHFGGGHPAVGTGHLWWWGAVSSEGDVLGGWKWAQICFGGA